MIGWLRRALGNRSGGASPKPWLIPTLIPILAFLATVPGAWVSWHQAAGAEEEAKKADNAAKLAVAEMVAARRSAASLERSAAASADQARSSALIAERAGAQADALKESALAAQELARTAQAQLEVTSRQVTAMTRPRVFIAGERIEDFAVGLAPRVTIILGNSGTPANELRQAALIDLVPVEMPLAPPPTCEPGHGQNNSSSVAREHAIYHVFRSRLSAYQFQQVNEGRWVFRVRGSVCYPDNEGRERRTTYCKEWRGKPPITDCATGNRAE